MHTHHYRRTTQELAPMQHSSLPAGTYDIYPAYPLAAGSVHAGVEELAAALAQHPAVTIEGYAGVLWEEFRAQLDSAFHQAGIPTEWVAIETALKPEAEIDLLIAPFLGGDDPLWGTKFTGTLEDFFDRNKLDSLHPSGTAALSIMYGSGAALAGWEGPLVYVDIPKNELQFRSRAGVVRNLGASAPASAKEMYKRFYFVDWPALNAHKEELLPRMDFVVDAQCAAEPLWLTGDALRSGLDAMARTAFRARPWFEPGPWGGQWMKERLPQLPQDAPNYAWSFELISPENGLMFESDGLLLEVSFDFLMYHRHREVLGNAADEFGTEFPIRFDFLDTFAGGNLSIQCHPRPEYIRAHFGESFTQDETYYILDCAPGAEVYLGFREGFDAAEFRSALERSRDTGEELEVERFVNTVPAHKHDLFLIPNGTIHCSGRDNLVLEISATPYIFTFKMYDWVRRDLEGNMRPLNIKRAFENLYLDRTSSVIEAEFIAQPRVIATGSDWQLLHLPTHPEHFYDVVRYEFTTSVEIETDGNCHVMSLVEGSWITLESANGMKQRYNYAETFIVPAAAGDYRLVNSGGGVAKVVQAFVKKERPLPGMSR